MSATPFMDTSLPFLYRTTAGSCPVWARSLGGGKHYISRAVRSLRPLPTFYTSCCPSGNVRMPQPYAHRPDGPWKANGYRTLIVLQRWTCLVYLFLRFQKYSSKGPHILYRHRTMCPQFPDLRVDLVKHQNAQCSFVYQANVCTFYHTLLQKYLDCLRAAPTSRQ